MAASKYLKHKGDGTAQEVTATLVGGSGTYDGLIPALDANGKLDSTMMPTGIGSDSVTVTASEALAAGDLVNVYNSSGTAAVRKADASNPAKFANGYVTAAVSSSASATVYFDDNNGAVSSLTPGVQFLSGTTPGKSTATAPTTTGYLVQQVGIALSATSLHVSIQSPIALA